MKKANQITMANAKEHILKIIKDALKENKLDIPFPEVENKTDFFAEDDMSLEERFATELTNLGGKFIFCSSKTEMMEQLQTLAHNLNWNQISTKDQAILALFENNNIPLVQYTDDLHKMEIGISSCECLIARTGSVLLSSAQEAGRSLPVYAPIRITIAYSKDLVWNISDAFARLKEKYQNNIPSMICLATGPSRTADIEKTLVVGVHGPKEVYVFLIDE